MAAREHSLADPEDLLARGRQLLATADRAGSGRAAHNLVPGADQVLTQTLLVLTADSVLADHTAPPRRDQPPCTSSMVLLC